jgi:hypothetical protein
MNIGARPRVWSILVLTRRWFMLAWFICVLVLRKIMSAHCMAVR